MCKLVVESELFNPRWGRMDKLIITLSEKEMVIDKGHIQPAICRKHPDHDPEWSGFVSAEGNSLFALLDNDQIRAPKIIQFAFYWTWIKWLEGAQEKDVKEALLQLVKWIDATSQSCPKNELFRGGF